MNCLGASHEVSKPRPQTAGSAASRGEFYPLGINIKMYVPSDMPNIGFRG